ncbi:MAG: SDR family NAD(P)-dependent oxidoreductase [Pseudomonadales bacterium]
MIIAHTAGDLNNTAQGVCANGGDAVAMAGDQRVVDDVQAVVSATEAKYGSIDLLINAAALTNNLGSLSNRSPEKWRNEIDICLTGP